jgi:hypothetical protein
MKKMIVLALIALFLAGSLSGCFPLVYKDVDVTGQKKRTTYGFLFFPVYRAEEERGG